VKEAAGSIANAAQARGTHAVVQLLALEVEDIILRLVLQEAQRVEVERRPWLVVGLDLLRGAGPAKPGE
jgi:hypothetical protein